MVLKLFETDTGFYYNILCGCTIVVHSSLVKFDKFDEHHIIFPIKCDVFRYGNHIFLLPPSENSKIVYLFETDGVINKIEGECQVLLPQNSGEQIDQALIIANPEEEVFVDYEEYYQYYSNRWISVLRDGEEEPHPIDRKALAV